MIQKIFFSFFILLNLLSHGQTEEERNNIVDFINKGSYREAINGATNLIKLYPNSEYTYYSYYLRGYAYNRMDNYYFGTRDLEKCLELNPEYSYALDDLLITYKESEKFDKALTILNRLISIDDQPKYHFDLGSIYYKLNDYESSVSSFTNYLNMGNENQEMKTQALFNRGVSKNALYKKSGCEDIKKSIKDAYIMSRVYPECLVGLGYSSLDFAYDSGCIDSYNLLFYSKGVTKASKTLRKQRKKELRNVN